MKIGAAHLEYRKDHGIETVSAKIADRLAAWGNDVHFHCVRHRHEGDSRVQFHKVPVISVFNTLKLATFAPMAHRQLQHGGYDITHSHGTVLGSDVITAHGCHRAGIKKLGWSEGLGTADKVRFWLEAQNYQERKYGRIIAVSRLTKRELMEEYTVPGSDISVVPPGTDPVDLQEISRHRRAVRSRYGIGEEDVVLLFIGHEFRRKGLDTVLRACAAMNNQHVHLWIGGEDVPGKFEVLARKCGIGNRTRFLGFQEGLSPIYAGADIFVFPTHYDAFGLVVLEAMAHGLPVIVSKTAGVAEDVIREGTHGILLENPASYEELAQASSALIADASTRQRMGIAGREQAGQLSWDACARGTLEVFEEVVRQKALI